MHGEIINALADPIHDIYHWFQTEAPGGLNGIVTVECHHDCGYREVSIRQRNVKKCSRHCSSRS